MKLHLKTSKSRKCDFCDVTVGKKSCLTRHLKRFHKCHFCEGTKQSTQSYLCDKCHLTLNPDVVLYNIQVEKQPEEEERDVLRALNEDIEGMREVSPQIKRGVGRPKGTFKLKKKVMKPKKKKRKYIKREGGKLRFPQIKKLKEKILQKSLKKIERIEKVNNTTKKKFEAEMKTLIKMRAEVEGEEGMNLQYSERMAKIWREMEEIGEEKVRKCADTAGICPYCDCFKIRLVNFTMHSGSFGLLAAHKNS